MSKCKSKINLISASIFLLLWHAPVSADRQYECGEIAVITTHAISLKNQGYSQNQAESEILRDSLDPDKAKRIINDMFSANTKTYKNMSFEEIYKINYKLCLAGDVW